MFTNSQVKEFSYIWDLEFLKLECSNLQTYLICWIWMFQNILFYQFWFQIRPNSNVKLKSYFRILKFQNDKNIWNLNFQKFRNTNKLWNSRVCEIWMISNIWTRKFKMWIRPDSADFISFRFDDYKYSIFTIWKFEIC